jgi:hypothetical protein
MYIFELYPYFSCLKRNIFENKTVIYCPGNACKKQLSVICWNVDHESGCSIFCAICLLKICVESCFALHVDCCVTKSVNFLYWWYHHDEIEPHLWTNFSCACPSNHLHIVHDLLVKVLALFGCELHWIALNIIITFPIMLLLLSALAHGKEPVSLKLLCTL